MSSSEEDLEARRCSTPEYKKLKRGDSRGKKQKHRVQSYRREWEAEAQFKGWLTGAKDSTKAHCRACNVDITAEITVIKNHAKSAKHVLKIKAIPKTTIKDVFKKAETPLDVQKKHAELKLTGFLTEHNISFNCVDHLTKVVKDCFPDSKIAQQISLGRTKATQITRNVVGSCSENDIVTLLRNNKFSLIIDEATDIAALKTLCVCVRFFHPEFGKVTTLFWKLIQIFSGDEPDKANEGATAERLYNEIRAALSSNEIPLQNVIGFASDGCNAMFGRLNSVASKLMAANPGIMVQKCICHSLHLCASEACKCLPRLCEDLARNIYGFFKNSAKRQAMLQEFQKFCDVDPHKILRPAQTRWLSLLSVVRRILEQWEPLRLFFTASYVEHRLHASEEIYHALSNPEIKLFYLFLDWVLPKFVDLNKYFQSERVVICHLHEKMVEAFRELLLSYLQPNYVRQTEMENIDPTNKDKFVPYTSMYLGIGVIQNIHSLTEAEIKQDFYERCRRFLITSCLEIKKRYNFNDPVLSKMRVLAKGNIKMTDTLFPLISSVPLICDLNNVEQLQKIDDQWRSLKSFENLPETDDIDKFYFALSKITGFAGELLFPDLSKFAIDVLSLPHSSASCERVFSKVNLIKTKSRNKLLTSTLNGILLSSQRMNLEDGCVNFKPTNKMMQLMTSANLYVGKKRSAAEAAGSAATASTSSAVNSDDDDEDIVFEEIQ